MLTDIVPDYIDMGSLTAVTVPIFDPKNGPVITIKQLIMLTVWLWLN